MGSKHRMSRQQRSIMVAEIHGYDSTQIYLHMAHPMPHSDEQSYFMQNLKDPNSSFYHMNMIEGPSVLPPVDDDDSQAEFLAKERITPHPSMVKAGLDEMVDVPEPDPELILEVIRNSRPPEYSPLTLHAIRMEEEEKKAQQRLS